MTRLGWVSSPGVPGPTWSLLSTQPLVCQLTKTQAFPVSVWRQTLIWTNGIDRPLPCQKESNGVGKHLCTYVHSSGPNVDEVDTTVADHDKECFPSVGPYSNELWGEPSPFVNGEVTVVEPSLAVIVSWLWPKSPLLLHMPLVSEMEASGW